jgi:hypothetical protein
MSMPIQRQSEQFGYFDDGPRFARDRSSTDLPRGLAALVNTSGPRIQGGMLNTRTAVNTDGMHPDSHAYHTELPPGRGGEVTWVDDAENYGRNPRREYNPDFGYEPTDEDERRQEGVAEDDESGYNWGPEPRRASRHPFDRTAGAWEDFFGDEMPSPFAGKDPENFFTDWLERGPKPGENDDPRDHKDNRSRTAACLQCGGDVLPDGGDWEHVNGPSDHEAEPDQDDYDNDDYGMGRDPARAMDEFKSRREGRRVALAPQDPAMAPQMPVGGGFLPGHRVGLDWRDRTIPGTVIANDGQVHIRWDEGQYTSEDPTEVRLL